MGVDALGSRALEAEGEVEQLGPDHALRRRITGIFAEDPVRRALDRVRVIGQDKLVERLKVSIQTKYPGAGAAIVAGGIGDEIVGPDSCAV